LALMVQEGFKRDPHAGDLWVFRGRRGDLIKLIWHDGDGACLFVKRLERGRFLWPSAADGVVRTPPALIPERPPAPVLTSTIRFRQFIGSLLSLVSLDLT
jgi:transposase